MQNRLMRVGMKYRNHHGFPQQVNPLQFADSETVIIAISLNRKHQKNIIGCSQTGKNNGASVIAITNYTEVSFNAIC
ncbi:hypothetical protein [Lentibacillus sp. CBA3610]|uniref:hypothetical protein n=1 Tax=Lentibacillus sp. CBA3610 TaxID=2518176 RepID=UPI00350E3AD3